MKLYGIEYLRGKLAKKRARGLERYSYYNQDYRVLDLGISTPEKLRNFQIRVGWNTTAVDELINRLNFKKFEDDILEINDIFKNNKKNVLLKSAMQSALINSCSFVYVRLNEDKNVKLQVIDGTNATGIMDVNTMLLTEGYAVLDRDDLGNATVEAYFTPESTIIYEYDSNSKKSVEVQEFVNKTGVPLLVPVVYKPSDTRPFGQSVITQACMDATQSASRTLKRMEITAEYYSYPQRYALGLTEDTEIDDKFAASISRLLTFYRDEESGQSPTVGQFQQQSVAPHIDQLASSVKIFCGETGLTSDDLGFVSSNPMSSEAIEASHDKLRLKAENAQLDFDVAFANVGFVSASLNNGKKLDLNAIKDLLSVWYPVFKPNASMLASIGDGAIKINQAVEGFINKNNLEKLTGIESDQ